MISRAELRGESCREADNRPVLAFGWCKLHYRRWRANVNRVQQYMPRSNKPDECWYWLGQNFSDGRPCFSWRKIGDRSENKIHAMRAVLMIRSGPYFIPEKLEAAHTCDNNLCINPRHGFWATHQQNCSGWKP